MRRGDVHSAIQHRERPVRREVEVRRVVEQLATGLDSGRVGVVRAGGVNVFKESVGRVELGDPGGVLCRT